VRVDEGGGERGDEWGGEGQVSCAGRQRQWEVLSVNRRWEQASVAERRLRRGVTQQGGREVAGVDEGRGSRLLCSPAAGNGVKMRCEQA